jgi:NADH-quinone oxidoreductase subunit C
VADETAEVGPGEELADDAPNEPAVETLHGAPLTLSHGQRVLHPSRDSYLDTAKALHDDGYLFCVDVTCVDYLTHETPRDVPPGVTPERFEVVVNLLSHAERSRVRLRVQVPDDDPVVPTLWHLYPSVEGAEREAFDMFGIRFDGHPDLTRILMPEDWVGHPLRKDWASGRIPVQFKEARR